MEEAIPYLSRRPPLGMSLVINMNALFVPPHVALGQVTPEIIEAKLNNFFTP